MKRFLIMVLIAIMAVMCVACNGKETIPEDPLMIDENGIRTFDDGTKLKTYRYYIIAGKKLAAENGYEYKAYDFSHTYAYEDLPTFKIERYFDFDGNDESVETLKRRYDRCMSALPDVVKAYLKDSGVVIHFVLDIYEYWNGEIKLDLNGLYSPNKNTIYIACGTEFKSEVAELGVLYHEIGHALDNYFGCPSQTKEFKRIYDEEADWENMSSNGTHNEAEWFADMFSLYVRAYSAEYNSVYKSSLDNKIPETYKFLLESMDIPEVKKR